MHGSHLSSRPTPTAPVPVALPDACLPDGLRAGSLRTDADADTPGVAGSAAAPAGAVSEDPWKAVKGLTPLSLCDWPGASCSVLFLGGCEMRCPTCHNATLAWAPETLPTLSRRELMDHFTRRAPWLDGVTVTGGEPTEHPGLATILEDIASVGLPVKLDTNGMRPQVVSELLAAGLVARFAVDVKGPFELYPRLTGRRVTAEEARENITALFALAEANPTAFYFRTTHVPALSAEDIETVRALLPEGFALTIQQYKAPQTYEHPEVNNALRRSHAAVYSEEGRMPGDVVGGPRGACDHEGAEGQRGQGPSAGQAACA